MRKRALFVIRNVLAILLIAAIVGDAMPKFVLASSKTQQEIDAAEDQKNDLEDKLDDKNKEIDQLEGKHKSLQEELASLNQQLTEVSERLADLEVQIANKEEEISETQAALDFARKKEEAQYEGMIKCIRFMYEYNDVTSLGTLLAVENFSDFLNLADYMERINDYNQNLLDEYEANRIYIESEEARLENERIELEDLKTAAQEEQNKVSLLIEQTSKQMQQYKDQISEAEKQALAYEEELKAVEKNLEYLKKKLAEELARSRAAAQAKWRDISEISFAEGDRKLLASIIYCEAGNQPYEGQLAVGAVVINRVRSSVFPNSVVGVIYQKNQFSPVASGRLELALANDRATANCYRAADEAMAGMTNVGNCVFFRTPIEGLTGIVIGGHVFY